MGEIHLHGVFPIFMKIQILNITGEFLSHINDSY